MSAITLQPTEPPTTPRRGPACGACAQPDAAEPAFGCEHCDAPLCGFCAAGDDPDWLCSDCARRAALTAQP